MSLIAKKFLRIIKIICFTIFGIAFLIIIFQDLLFLPYLRDSITQSASVPERGERVELITKGGSTIETWIKDSKVNPSRGLCMVFRGNSNDLNSHWSLVEWCSVHGYKAVIFNYPGMGLSSGWPSENTIAETAERVYQSFYTSGDLLVLGYSIGTGPATQFSIKHPPKDLLLFAPFPNLKSIVATRTIYKYLVYFSKYNFPINNYLKLLSTTRLIVLSGGADTTIPKHFSDEVFEAYQGPKVRINNPSGDHSSLLGANIEELNQFF